MSCCISSLSLRQASCWEHPRAFSTARHATKAHHSAESRLRHRCGPRKASADNGRFATVEDVQAALSPRGFSLTVKDLGPLYRITCRRDADGQVVAVTNGWINPLPRFMHCETLQVFPQAQDGKAGATPGGLLGLGVYVGVATMAYAKSNGCTRAEILAINDSDEQHAKLLKYYRFFGFQAVKTVGDGGLADLPDQVVWGGVGTRMDADVDYMLRRWSPVVFRGAADG